MLHTAYTAYCTYAAYAVYAAYTGLHTLRMLYMRHITDFGACGYFRLALSFGVEGKPIVRVKYEFAWMEAPGA